MGPQIPKRSKRSRKLFWVLAFTIAVGIATVLLTLQRASVEAPVSAAESKPAEADGGSALGHIEPEDGVIHVSAPSVAGATPLVEELRVREGERVSGGQI